MFRTIFSDRAETITLGESLTHAMSKVACGYFGAPLMKLKFDSCIPERS